METTVLKRKNAALFWVVILMQLSLGGTSEGSPKIVPDQNVQVEMGRLTSALSDSEANRSISNLYVLAKGDLEKIIPQLIYYRAEVKRLYRGGMLKTSEMETKMDGTILVLRKLAKDSENWQQRILNAILPYLQQEDPSMAEQMRWILKKIDYKGAKNVDFLAYERFLKENRESNNSELIKYMYDRDPQAAVLSMALAYGDKNAVTELADQLQGEQRNILRLFAERPEWWARLYVAGTMKKNPRLRDTAILKKLEKDDNPLVRQMVSEIMSGA